MVGVKTMRGVLCIQCVDPRDGLEGCFLQTPESTKENRVPVTPRFPGLATFFPWLRAMGWAELPHDKRYPTGLFENLTIHHS